MNLKLLDPRIGRANRIQFFVFMIPWSLILIGTQASSLHILVQCFIYLFLLYVFILIANRRLHDLECYDNENFYKLNYNEVPFFVLTTGKSMIFLAFDLLLSKGNQKENRHGLPTNRLNFFSMVTDGYPIPRKEWVEKFKQNHYIKPINKDNHNELCEAPIRGRKL